MIRHRGKLPAVRTSAARFLELDRDGNAAEYLWSFVDGMPFVNRCSSTSEAPATTPKAEVMSKALRAKWFKFVGPTICDAFMRASGLVNDHLSSRFRDTQYNQPGERRCVVA